ncbi:MAG: hypothetical protein WHU94_03245 [Thermogemmata sp.]|nr:hypothetical protein [Thermogemmata fonticola]GIW84680.1 MAG: hypothetical protein KatS3mg107_0340 [Gemmataceae bacterium]
MRWLGPNPELLRRTAGYVSAFHPNDPSKQLPDAYNPPCMD